MKAMLLRFSFIFLSCLILFSACNFSETGISIKGKIINLDNYNFTDSFIQLVALNLDSQKLELTEATVIRGIDGNTLGIDCVSEFPKLKLSKDGKFKYKIEDLKPGRYIMVIQHLIPLKKPASYFGPGPWLSRPLGKEKNKINVVEISEKDKPPYSINLGEVNITYNKSDKFIITEFDEVVFIKP